MDKILAKYVLSMYVIFYMYLHAKRSTILTEQSRVWSKQHYNHTQYFVCVCVCNRLSRIKITIRAWYKSAEEKSNICKFFPTIIFTLWLMYYDYDDTVSHRCFLSAMSSPFSYFTRLRLCRSHAWFPRCTLNESKKSYLTFCITIIYKHSPTFIWGHHHSLQLFSVKSEWVCVDTKEWKVLSSRWRDSCSINIEHLMNTVSEATFFKKNLKRPHVSLLIARDKTSNIDSGGQVEDSVTVICGHFGSVYIRASSMKAFEWWQYKSESR